MNQALDGHLILVATMYELAFNGMAKRWLWSLNRGGCLVDV